MKPTFWALLPFFAGLALGAPAAAQVSKSSAPVYEANDVTPCSFDVLTATELIQSRAVYPADFLKSGASGEVHVSFVLDAAGKTRDAQVMQYPGYEPADPVAAAAVLAAIKGLPKLQPALRAGKPVAVRMPLTIRYPNPEPSKMYSAGPNRVYQYAEQMPELPAGGGAGAIVAAAQKNLLYPEAARQAKVTGRVFVKFIIGADGVVRDVQVAKGLGSGCDEAAVAAVRQLPALKPGMQNGCPVAVAYTVPLTFAGQ
ncbi:energy transducer TonB [Hymenobacter armeniacus]|uniref:TonB family protein n=1 Tax=Hymenobacter armeniacus TaxID=2771358 RepID=A0ABR8K0G8_9BACT|nr:energy transducer TonB [Hymenobacter armeniacus]MBD2724525.1 TonB family protein [Hymenobacter armeniacus]